MRVLAWPPTRPTLFTPAALPAAVTSAETSGADATPVWPIAWIPHRIGEGLIGPLIPVYAATLAGASAGAIGLMEALFSGLGILGALAWGKTSDDVGKRKAFIVIGFAGATIAFAGMFLATSFWHLAAWRAVQGFVVAAYAAAGGALIADTSKRGNINQRMGFMHTVAGIGYVIGLAIGAYVALTQPPQDLFGIAATLTLLSVVAALALIREPEAHLDRGEVHRLFRNMSLPITMPIQRRVFAPSAWSHRPKLSELERRAWAYLVATALAFVGTAAGFVLFPLYLVEIGVSNSTIFLLFLANALFSTLLFAPAGRLADKVGFRPLQLGAIGGRSFMFAILVLPVLPGMPAALVFLLLAGATWAVLQTTGATALLRSMSIGEPGELVGLYSASMGVGSLLGALLGGVLAGVYGFTVLFVVAGLLVAVALVLMATLVYPKAEEELTYSGA